MVIQLTDQQKSGNWMFPVTEGLVTKCLLYNEFFNYQINK